MTATVLPMQSPEDRSLPVIERRLRAFLVGRLEGLPSTEAFVLYHEASGAPEAKPEAIHTHRCADAKKKREATQDSIADAVAKDVLAVAQCHYESFGGEGQRYRLAAEIKGEVLQSHYFGLGMTGKPGRGLELAEKSGGSGFGREVWQQNKDLHRTCLELVACMAEPIQTLAQQLARVTSENMMHDERRRKLFETTEELMDRKEDRALVRMREERAQRRKDNALDKFFDKIAPAVASHVLKKIDPDGDGTTVETKQLPESKIAETQAVLRQAFKVIGRDTIAVALPADKRPLLDDLTGLGVDPKDMEELREKLQVLWAELPDEVSDAMEAKLLAEKPALLMRLAELAKTAAAKEPS